MTLVLVLASLAPRGVLADPDYPGPLLYGLDPVLKTTDDPRLLGPERLILRQRLLRQGVDPLRDPPRPTLASTVKRRMDERAGVDLERRVEVVESSGFYGLQTVFRYPEYFFLFQASQQLPGGLAYFPPRPVGAEEVSLFVDDLDRAQEREWAVTRDLDRADLLDVAGGGRRTGQREGLINLTIPIKLPRTLEKIIGRGEKTSIKITGREHIAITGESSVSNQFTPNERVKSQSLFPDLDMEQQLQVNLSGQIGEKIFVEVDHNSEVIGPEGTKIKLSYQGDEDEIIQTIETGDVGLTLPGSQLLGYSSNKSGLFGLKVTGQVGRADFTVVASKQKAESSTKSFNSKGGEVTEHVIEASGYLNNRFFRLDLPQVAVDLGYDQPDLPGRQAGWGIDQGSVFVYQAVTGNATDVERNIAVVADTTGRWDYPAGGRDIDAIPASEWTFRQYWRPLEWEPLLDQDGNVVAIDLGREMGTNDLLAVTYDVVDQNGDLVYRVGDRPGVDPRELPDPQENLNYYRMKLLKPEQRDPFTFQYVLRNIYPLGGTNIDAESFELSIQRKDSSDQPDLDENGLPYIQVFGLDQRSASGDPVPDGIVDKNDTYLFDLRRGLLIFPLDFPHPFDGTREQYEAYANVDDFIWDGTFLQEALTDKFYIAATPPNQYIDFSKFQLVAAHAAASSSFNLGVTNIEEGSETVVLDGRTLQRGVDYEIDYTFGQISLKGDAANLTADSQIQVNYQYAPFFGGGQSNLLGFNLGYDLGRESQLSTTWLYESNSIVGHKPKLGEEPSKNVVGNLNLQHTFKPYFLTHVANFLSRRDSEKESTLKFSGEAAVSIPNPNTRDKVYLEDFEGLESSDVITLSRLGWSQASAPVLPGVPEQTVAERRLDDIRWFLPEERVLRRYLNPELREQERNEGQQALQIYLNAGQDGWTPETWGGVMRGVSRAGLDLTQTQFLEFWINDFAPDEASRRGKLHIDFGYIDEDFHWRKVDGSVAYGVFDKEDVNDDGVFTYEEDVGLDGIWNAARTEVLQEGEPYDAEYVGPENPFPGINNTARNNREDTEDLNGNTVLDRDDGYFSVVIDLAETEALVDVVNDYPDEDLTEILDKNLSWRKYRIPLNAAGGEDSLIDEVVGNLSPDIAAVTHVRVWYEDDQPGAPQVKQLQLSELKFLGSRWERDGIRKTGDEELLSPAERAPGEAIFIGEVNNKENPDYVPPFAVHEENRIPEKEQSLTLTYDELQPGHVARIRKQVSPQGDDYTLYDRLTWYWNNRTPQGADLDLFFRVGSDTLNYYEVGMQYVESEARLGWKRVEIDLAELANVKNDSVSPDGIIRSQIADIETGFLYDVRVVGRPDLRRIKRYYFGVANNTRWSQSGQFWLNDVILESVKRDIGLAERVGLRLNMADVIKLDVDWSHQDAEFHGLNSTTGQGHENEDLNLSTNFRVDDFIPLAGFQANVGLSRRSTVQRPKYETNSDIEIIDPVRKEDLSSYDNRDSYSLRISHEPSRRAIPRYLIDPWTFQVSGSWADRDSPLELSTTRTLTGAVNYDLRIPDDLKAGSLPLLGIVPLVKGLSLLPSKISAGANFNENERYATSYDVNGNPTVRPPTHNKSGQLNGSLDYQPLYVVNLGFRNRSERDLLRPQEVLGVNIGEENRYTQDLQMTFNVPKPAQFPGGPVFWPVRAAAKGLNQLRPSVTFTGQFSDAHDPNTRQPDDPPDVRNVGNSGDWEFRAKVPVGDIFESIFPERKRSREEEQRLIEEQRRLEQRQRARGQRPGAPADTTQAPPDEDWEDLTPEERLQREQERLLEEAERRREEEAEQSRRGEGRAPAPAAADTAAGGDEPGTWDQAPADTSGGGFHLHIPDPTRPLLSLLRGIGPVQMSYTDRRSSSYARLRDTAPFWYKVGLASQLDVADSLYVNRSLTDGQTLSLSTNAQISRRISLDVKYNESRRSREQTGTVSQDYQQDWPDLNLSVTGLEQWGIFGGGGENRDEGWFRPSSLNFSYTASRPVNGYTDDYFNPRNTTTITPRWNFTLQSGMTVTLNGTISQDDQLQNGNRTVNDRLRVGVQVQHSFNAQSLLAKLGLYRPGNQPTVTMNLDLSYQANKTERFVPGSAFAQAPTGTRSIQFNPRFSYQVSQNLSGAVRFTFNRQSNIATDLTTTSFGLGVEATFVF